MGSGAGKVAGVAISCVAWPELRLIAPLPPACALEAIREATGIDLLDFTRTRRWVERQKLVDSPRFTHALKLLRDLFGDDELRARVDRASRPDSPDDGR